MKTYSDRSNASRAAKAAAVAAGIPDPKAGVHYAIKAHKGEQGPEFSFALLETAGPQGKWKAAAEAAPETAKREAPVPTAAEKKAAAKEKATEKALAKIAPDAQRVRKSTAEAAAKAAQGHLPEPPDFTADTHKRFRPRLAELVALAKAGDVRGLKAYAINPVSTSPKALDRYRNLCVIALEAKAAKAKAAEKGAATAAEAA